MGATPPPAELTAQPQPRPKPRGPPLHQIYALPAPIRTFPLPSFYPNNPVSLFHLVYTWVKQVLSLRPAEPSVIHTGVWDPDSRSVHVTHPAAVRALWEQGFYGKGNLSRSEPNWLKREQIRRGAVQGDVSEQRTALRREERRQVKWERARTEQEALERTRREEAQVITSGGEKSDASSVLPVSLGLPVDSELAASKSEPLGASHGTSLLQRSPLEAAADEPINATETEAEDTAMTSSNTGEEPEASLDGASEAYAEDSAPAKQNTSPSPVSDHDAQVTSHDISPAVISVAPAIAETRLLSKAPVGPLELLALPNCPAALRLLTTAPLPRESVVAGEVPVVLSAPVGPLELLALPNSAGEIKLRSNAVAVLESVEVERTVAVTDVPEAEPTLGEESAPDQASPPKSPVGPLELLALPNSSPPKQTQPVQSSGLNGVTVNGISPETNLAIHSHVSQGPSVSKSPVGPLELLALPNSLSALRSDLHRPSLDKNVVVNGSHDAPDLQQRSETQHADASPVSSSRPIEEDDAGGDSPQNQADTHVNGHTNGTIFGVITTGPVITDIAGFKRTIALRDGPVEQPPKRRRKSVRFSPTVESTTFLHHDPPSPGRSVLVEKCNGDATPEAISTPREAVVIPAEASAGADQQEAEGSALPVSPETASALDVTADIENKEHLQLSAEEAFFLSYGIGALSILDPGTKLPIPREKLLGLFRSHSYFPPRQELQPNDPFLVHYAVYHHFRSLGWVPRHGIKFGVDWMLYTRGPVFDHAEFGLIVMPAYSHSWWKDNGVEAPRKSWHWLHGVNRVLSHVLKSLVLVYVDVPPPQVFDAAMAAGGISAALKEYKVREFMVRRWSSNRNR